MQLPIDGCSVPKCREMASNIMDTPECGSTIGEVFKHYVQYCEPWEVAFTQNGKTRSPQEWLNTLDEDSLNSVITESVGDDQGDRFTAVRKTLFGTTRMTFSRHWHPDRHGWYSIDNRPAHYFVPRHWMNDPPYTSDGMLIALCKRNWIGNYCPFYPIDPNKKLCKTCDKRHAEWNEKISRQP